MMENPDFRRYTILVAEDNNSSYLYIEAALKNTGITILWARSGIETLELCKSNDAIDLILMDGMMPEMTGYDATREIRNFRYKLPIILLTAYVSSASFHQAVSSGCNDYLAKPIGREELIAILKKWLPA